MKKRKTRYFLSALLLASGLYCSQGLASISVYPIEVSLAKDRVSKIELMSQSKDVSFVRVTVKKIINPGTPEEKEAPVNITGDDSLIVTPQKFAITPGATRMARLIALKPPEKETTWRVYFEEVSENNFNGVDELSDSKKTASVGVNIVWGALVHVAPRNLAVSLKVDSKTGMLINEGTVRISLTEVGECTAASACDWKKEGATIYPDTRVRLRTLSFHPDHLYKARFKDWINNKNEEISLPIISGSE